MPVNVTDVQVSGCVRLIFKPLLTYFPLFGAIEISLASKPQVRGQRACPHAQLGIPETGSRADSGIPPAASRLSSNSLTQVDFDLRALGGDITLLPGVAVVLRAFLKNLLASFMVGP